MLKIGDIVQDEDGCVGIVLIKYADGDLCPIENDAGHPNPKKVDKDTIIRFAGNESFRRMVKAVRERVNEVVI